MTEYTTKDGDHYVGSGAQLTMLQRVLYKDYGIDAKWDDLRHVWAIEADTTRRTDQLRAAWHEGYTAALRRRETETWQLDRERMEAVHRLRDCRATNTAWVEAAFERIGGAILGENGFIVNHYEDIEKLIESLIHLLGGDSNSANSGGCSANNLQNSPNPINKDAEPPSYFMEFAEFHKLDDREKVVRKLQALRFNGGSHENLSKIAYAIYPCATSWTCESAAGLRGVLVRLLGGSDGGHCLQSDVCGGSCADGGAGDSGELAEVVTFANIRKKRDELAATMEQLKDELDRIKGLLQ